MKIIYEKGDTIRVKETGEVTRVAEFLPDRGIIRAHDADFRVDDVTPVVFDYYKKATELADLATLHGLEGHEFEEEIEVSLREKVRTEANALKTRGIAAQIEFLLGSLGTHKARQDAALELVTNIIKDNASKGMCDCLACRQRTFKEKCATHLDGWRCPECVAVGKMPVVK